MNKRTCCGCGKDIEQVHTPISNIIVCKECEEADKSVNCDMCGSILEPKRDRDHGEYHYIMEGKWCMNRCGNKICNWQYCGSHTNEITGKCTKCVIGEDTDRFRRIADKVLAGSAIKSATKQ